MAYFRPSEERPRATKRFLTAREVEDMAAAGTIEIVHVDGLVITDAAREVAHDLGLRIVKPQPQQTAKLPERDASRPPQAAVQGTGPSSSAAVPPGPAGHVGSVRVASAGARPETLQARSLVAADPLLRAVVDAVRSNRPKLATIAEGD